MSTDDAKKTCQDLARTATRGITRAICQITYIDIFHFYSFFISILLFCFILEMFVYCCGGVSIA